MSREERTSRDVGGAVGGAMVLFIAFALVAVIMLSSTVLSAININNNVAKTITPAVKNINSNLNAVPLLDQTNTIAGQILQAATPLSAQAGQIVSATDSINAKTTSIHAAAVSINGSVRSIDGHVGSINNQLGTIDTTVDAINGKVGTINVAVNSISSDVGAINASVQPINNTVNNIGATFASLNPVVTDIKGATDQSSSLTVNGTGIYGINNRADKIIALVKPIQADTATIRSVVPQIDANAAAINNAPILASTTAILNVPAVLGVNVGGTLGSLLQVLGLSNILGVASVHPAVTHVVHPAVSAASVPRTQQVAPSTPALLPNLPSLAPNLPVLPKLPDLVSQLLSAFKL